MVEYCKFMNKKKLYKYGGFFVLVLVFSCTKKSAFDSNLFNTDGSPKRAVTSDVRDSVYFYAETAYLWYQNLPSASAFKPANYGTPEEVINAVRTFSEKAPTGVNRDKWSFVLPKKTWQDIASGNSKNFGVYFRFAADGNLYVRQVFDKSSAGLQGVARGWKVLAINGVLPKNDETNLNQINQALSATSAEIKFELPDKTLKTKTLNQIDYKTNTIQGENVFEFDTKKIGYFCFTDFLGDDSAAGLDKVFSDFKNKGVNELIVDLRYNGGGYISLAQQLSNLIAPSATSGKVMFTYEYNDKLKKYNTTTTFKPINGLNLTKIVFITSKNSASASELVINALKPHMEVKIVGSNSHGKPVGFPVIAMRDYVVAPVAFKTVNSAGKADYYEGFTPDFPEADDLTKPFGDPNELCLKVALEYLKTGKVITSSIRNARILAADQLNIVNEKLPTGFEGMYSRIVDIRDWGLEKR